MATPQNYSNHAQVVPLYHRGLTALVTVLLVWTMYGLVRAPGADSVFRFLLVVSLILTAFYARAFALKAQDRVIRLEMRLRMRELLPADLAPRIVEFTPRQLVALRFAGDDELPSLARKVLDDRIEDGRTIKKMITNWQADTFRV